MGIECLQEKSNDLRIQRVLEPTRDVEAYVPVQRSPHWEGGACLGSARGKPLEISAASGARTLLDAWTPPPTPSVERILEGILRQKAKTMVAKDVLGGLVAVAAAGIENPGGELDGGSAVETLRRGLLGPITLGGPDKFSAGAVPTTPAFGSKG